jgi:hypothetical protein
LEIVELKGTDVYEWNGVVEDRDLARGAFDRAVASGALAVAYDSPKTGTVVRSFTDVEEIEKEKGTVTVRVTKPLAGG